MSGEDERSENWRRYYAETTARPPRHTLLAALGFFPPAFTGQAVDLGCGAGRDVLPLLDRGWLVHAIDAEASAIALLRQAAGPNAERLSTAVARFEAATWPACDLVNSSFALPLCPPEAFDGLWRRIMASLRPGGRFAGQLYGERDSWFGRPGMTFHSRAALDRLLDGLAVELLEEEESDGVTPRGQPKHWHIFHLVLRRL